MQACGELSEKETEETNSKEAADQMNRVTDSAWSSR